MDPERQPIVFEPNDPISRSGVKSEIKSDKNFIEPQKAFRLYESSSASSSDTLLGKEQQLSKYEVLSSEIREIRSFYEDDIVEPDVMDLGPKKKLEPRYVGDKSPFALRELSVEYPKALNEAYEILAEEHDAAFMRIVEKYKEWTTDYQFAKNSFGFQIDGRAFSERFLKYVADKKPEDIAKFLKIAVVFEVENNIAAYDLNSRLWPYGTRNETWHGGLEGVRGKTGKKIALLASSEEKYNALLRSELGLEPEDNLPSEEEIRLRTGFDAVWGPEQLIGHFNNQRDKVVDGVVDSDYLFFGRTSRTTEWLKDPNHTVVKEPFLEDPILRRYVRAFAITHNFDNPALSLGDPRIFTDTKAALCAIGGAYRVTGLQDIYSQEFLDFLKQKKYLIDNGKIHIDRLILQGEQTEKLEKLKQKAKKKIEGELTVEAIKKIEHSLERYIFNIPRAAMLSQNFQVYLRSRGIDPKSVADGTQKMRVKPEQRSYGAYGHERGSLTQLSFKDKLKKGPTIGGHFVIQPEMENYEVIDQNTGRSYLAIDRVFFVRGNDGRLERMEGVRVYMPKDSSEGRKNNVHAGEFTLDAPISRDNRNLGGVIFTPPK